MPKGQAPRKPKATHEINGVKMQVDLRYATRIEELRVGDKVKVLTKGYSGHTVHSGVIIGFEPFKELPTIVVCYVASSYSEVKLEFVHYNAKSENVNSSTKKNAAESQQKKQTVDTV